MKAFLRLLLPVALVLVLAACGNDDDGNGDPGDMAPNGDDSGAPPDDENGNGDNSSGEDGNGSAAPPAGSGEGTLTLDGVTYEFDVVHCGFNPEETGNEDVVFSMRGQGTTPDGEPFEVDAVSLEINDTDSESVSLWIGDTLPYDVMYESHRIQMNDMVTGTGDSSESDAGMDWPLIQVDGGEVRAESGYVESDSMDSGDETFAGLGTLEATCP